MNNIYNISYLEKRRTSEEIKIKNPNFSFNLKLSTSPDLLTSNKKLNKKNPNLC